MSAGVWVKTAKESRGQPVAGKEKIIALLSSRHITCSPEYKLRPVGRGVGIVACVAVNEFYFTLLTTYRTADLGGLGILGDLRPFCNLEILVSAQT